MILYVHVTYFRSKVVAELDKSVNAGVKTDDALFLQCAALIYMHEQNYDAALRILHQEDDLERLVWSIYLRNE